METNMMAADRAFKLLVEALITTPADRNSKVYNAVSDAVSEWKEENIRKKSKLEPRESVGEFTGVIQVILGLQECCENRKQLIDLYDDIRSMITNAACIDEEAPDDDYDYVDTEGSQSSESSQDPVCTTH